MGEETLDALQQNFKEPHVLMQGEPLDTASAALLGAEDAIKAAQDARWHSSRSHPAIAISRYSETGPAFGRRLAAAHREGWGQSIWDAYYRAFMAQLASMDIALISKPNDENRMLLWVVDLRQWEPRPGTGVRLDEPMILINPEEGWQRRGRWRRLWSRLFTG